MKGSSGVLQAETRQRDVLSLADSMRLLHPLSILLTVTLIKRLIQRHIPQHPSKHQMAANCGSRQQGKDERCDEGQTPVASCCTHILPLLSPTVLQI